MKKQSTDKLEPRVLETPSPEAEVNPTEYGPLREAAYLLGNIPIKDDPGTHPKIVEARQNLRSHFPLCVSLFEVALGFLDVKAAKLLVRYDRGKRQFITTSAGVGLEELGRGDLVERAAHLTAAFPDHDPTEAELRAIISRMPKHPTAFNRPA
jgi:hypothetical protein